MTTIDASAVPATDGRAAASGAPRLAEGVELLGEYQGSAYREPRYLAVRPDGQVVALPRLLHLVAAALDGHRDGAAVARALHDEHAVELDAATVDRLVETKLRPAGIAAAGPGGGGTVASPRPDPLLMLRFRLPVVPEGAVWRVAGAVAPLFRPAVVVAVLLAFVAVDAAILAGGLAPLAGAAVGLVRDPASTLLVVVALLLAGALHECGHVGACRYGGARPGPMGVGIYLVWPAYYSTVTDSYRLSRAGRLRTDLGGVYVNALLMAAGGAAWLATGAPWLLVAVLVLHVETARQFLPSIRLDGYYILSDLVGLPDLFMFLRPVLSGLVPGRPRHPRVAQLTPWARRIIVTWVLLVVPFLLSFLVLFLVLAPQVLPAVWAALLGHLAVVGAAVRAGDATLGTLHVVQVLLLALPVLGGSLLVGLAVRRVGGWARSTPRPRRGPDHLAALAAVGGPVLLLALLVLAGLDQRAASASEAALAAAALGPGGGAAARQIGAVGELFGGPGQDGVLAGARAVCLGAGVAAALLLWPVARRLRLPGRAAAVAVLLAAAPALVAPLHGAVDAGAPAAFWLVVAAALAGRGRGAATAAAAAAGLGVLTAPVAAVGLLAFAAHGVGSGQLATSWKRGAARAGAAALAVAAVLAAVLVVPVGDHGEGALGPAALAAVVVAGAAVVGVAMRRLRPLRPVATGTGALLAVALVPGPAGGTAALLALPAVSVLAAVLVYARSDPQRPRQLRVLLAAGLGAALLATGPAVTAAAAPDPDPHRLATWVRSELGPDARIAAGPLVAAQLRADGVPAARLTGPDDPTADVRAGADGGPVLLALAAGPGGDPLTVSPTRPVPPVPGPPGPLLAGNPALRLTPQAGAVLRADGVDRRVTATLAGLAGVHDLDVAAFPAVPGEPADAPRRRVVVTAVDGIPARDPAALEVLTRWLDGQQPPYRPAGVLPGPAGVTVHHPIELGEILMTRLPVRLAAVLVLAGAALLGAVGAAAAQPAQAYVRLAHLSPDTPPVDVYLTSAADPELRFVVPGVDYGSLSDYRALPTGTYTVAMRLADAPPDGPPVIATSLTTGPGAAYTVAGTGPYTALGLEVLSDDLTMPAAGQARVRVVNAAAGAARVDVALAGGPALAEAAGFATTTDYRAVPAGDWTLRVTPAGGEPQELAVRVPPNSVHTVLLLDGPDGIVARAHRDSVGAATVPAGSVATGFGGASGAGAGLLVAALGAGLAGALAVRVAARWARR